MQPGQDPIQPQESQNQLPQPVPQAYPHQQYDAPQSMQQPQKKSGKKWLIIAIVALVLVAAAVAIYFWLAPKSAPTGNSSGVQSAGGLTAQTLATKKDDLFWQYFKNAAMQPEAIVTHSQVRILNTGDKVGEAENLKVGFNYKTKALTAMIDQLDDASNTKVVHQQRCYNAQLFTSNGDAKSWKQEADAYNCSLGQMASFLADGVNTGGLDDKQASAFVDFLRSKKDLFTVSSAKLEDHKGKAYAHFSVDIKPILFETGTYEGVPWLQLAFEKTGLDSQTYPYYPKETFGGGFHIEYWADPTTNLPVYTSVIDTPIFDDKGQPEKQNGSVNMTTIFDFGKSTFDATTSNNALVDPKW